MPNPTVMQENGHTYLTVPEVSQLMETPETRVREWARAGEFGAFKHSGSYLFPSERLEMLAVEDVALMLRVNVQTVRRWARDKLYPTIKLGRRYYFARDRLLRGLKEREEAEA